MKRTLAAVTLVLTGCTQIPADPDSTLAGVRDAGVLRVGASPSAGRVEIDGGEVSGTEAELVEEFAEQLGVDVAWVPGGEQELVVAVEEGELDLMVGGLALDSPWAERVSLTRPYGDGTLGAEPTEFVMAVPLGENAMLAELEASLDRSAP